MSGDDEVKQIETTELKDAATKATALIEELAVSGQEKPAQLQEKEVEQAELRKKGRTPSSVDLPKMDLDVTDYAVQRLDEPAEDDAEQPAVVDEGFRERTIYSDGSEEGYYRNSGSRYERQSLGDGYYTEENWGDRDEKCYLVEKNCDGYTITPGEDADLDKVVNVEKDRLAEQAETKFDTPEEQKAFKDNLEKFQKRSAEIEEQKRNEFEAAGWEPDRARELAKKETAEQMVGTYREIGRLLDAEGDKPLKEADRKKIAAQVLENAADPTSIDQKGPTCQVTAVEVRCYTRNPADAARLVADMSINGEYHSRGFENAGNGLFDKQAGESDQTVQMDASNLAADYEAQAYPDGGRRSHASQIFQTTAININYQREGGNCKYEQLEDPKTDPRERVWTRVDYSEDPPIYNKDDDGYLSSGTSVGNKDLTPIYNQITGEYESTFVVERGDKPISDNPEDPETLRVSSEEELKSQLQDMKKNGKLPATIFVDSAKEPFHSDSGHVSKSWHLVTVTDIDDDGNVSLDNQWGEDVDHIEKDKRLTTGQLYEVMGPG